MTFDVAGFCAVLTVTEMLSTHGREQMEMAPSIGKHADDHPRFEATTASKRGWHSMKIHGQTVASEALVDCSIFFVVQWLIWVGRSGNICCRVRIYFVA